MDAGRELDGFGHLLPRVIAACRIEVHVLDELLRGLTHIEDHLVVGGVVILSCVARHKRDGAALAGVNREGDGVAALVVPELGVDVRGRGWADLALRHGMAVPARDLHQHARRQRFHPEHVTHWNTQRRQVKLKGLTPAEYRDQALQQAA